MIRKINKFFGIRDPTPTLEPQERAKSLALPSGHPCRGCVVLDLKSGRPYRFLPRRSREIFELAEGV